MTVLSIVVLTVFSWGQRLLGAFALGPVLERRPSLRRALDLLPAAVVAAVVVQLSVARGRELVVDARLGGLAVAILLVWRRLPFIVVVLAAAATTAALRAVGG